MWLLSALSLALWSCAEGGVTPEDTTETTVETAEIEQALENIAGGLGSMDDRDEEPAFGSEPFAREFGADDEGEPAGDDLAEDEEMRDAIARGEYRLLTIMAVWGRIRPNDNQPIGLEWNPVISVREVDRVRVRRTLRFERGDQVLPQSVRNQVEILSTTRPHVDGVILQLAIRTVGAEAQAPYLNFRSLPLSLQIPGAALPDLDQQHLIDRAGNGLTLVVLERPVDVCLNGFLAGRWIETHEHGGVFGGTWRTVDGRLEAHLAGRFGVTPDGAQVFSGKIIERDGRFRGFLSGVWGDGEFRGEWFSRSGHAPGVAGALCGPRRPPDGSGRMLQRGR
jgi:hypothetical protein